MYITVQKCDNMALTKQQQKKAYQYYIMGLNSKEIGKLLDVHFRAVQHLAQSAKWKQSELKDKRKAKALELYQSDHSYNEIAEKIGVGRTTVYNWLKETRAFKERQRK